MSGEFAAELAGLINRHSVENESDTPDFLLARFLGDCLTAWNRTTRARDEWLGPNPVVRRSGKQLAAGGSANAEVEALRAQGDTPTADPPGVGLLLPGVGLTVHYRSFGTPGGEYPPACRAATVAGVGAWLPVPGTTSDEVVHDDGRRFHTVEQEWCPDACALVVANPDGLFFKTVAHDRASHDTPGTWQGGTWHWPIPGLCEQ